MLTNKVQRSTFHWTVKIKIWNAVIWLVESHNYTTTCPTSFPSPQPPFTSFPWFLYYKLTVWSERIHFLSLISLNLRAQSLNSRGIKQARDVLASLGIYPTKIGQTWPDRPTKVDYGNEWEWNSEIHIVELRASAVLYATENVTVAGKILLVRIPVGGNKPPSLNVENEGPQGQ